MIAVYIRIDYHGQLRRIDSRAAMDLHTRLEELSSDYGARPNGRSHPFIAYFNQNSIFWRLQAAEALLAFRELLEGQFEGIMDYFLALHSAEDEDVLRSDLNRAWTDLETPRGVWLTSQTAAELEKYLSLKRAPSGLFEVLGPSYRMNALSMTAQKFYRRDEAAAGLSELIGDLIVGGEKNVLLVRGAAGTGKEATVAHALASLGYPTEGLLTLRGGTANPRPFDPLACGVTVELADAVKARMTPVESALYDRLLPAYRFMYASPYKSALSPSVETGYRLFTSLILRAYARDMSEKGLPPLILCENLHRFSPESLDLLGEIFVASDAKLLATTAKGAPESWPAYTLAEWSLASPSFEEYAEKLAAVLPDSSEEVRRQLFSRARGDLPLLYRCALMVRDGMGGPPPSEAILGRMPKEAAAALYAASLCENVLDIQKFHAFLEQLGLRPKARSIVLEILRDTGYISGPGSRNSSRLSNRRLFGFVGKDAERIDEAFAEYLISLYRSREISPSLGLLSATKRWEGKDHRKFELDCAISDALEDPADRGRSANREVPPYIRKIRDLMAYILLGDKDRAEYRLQELEDSSARPSLPRGVPELFRAELALGRRSFPEAANEAKEALLNSRGAGIPRTETRAHRILGLCSLAREKPEEATEYFENARDIAASARDDYERLVCQWCTSIALFTSGKLDKSLKTVQGAEETAMRVFRRDWEAACGFLRSRINMELGRYEEARAGFQGIRSIARAYGFQDANQRAEIWDARTEAYLGSYEGAQVVLERYKEDPEAQFFLGELELLRGNPGKATETLSSLPPILHGDFSPSDQIFWDSGYRGIERRAFGAAAEAPFDADLAKAYTLFAEGLEKREAAYATALYRMTREEKIAQEHPAFSVYLYFCFLLLERLSEPPLDKSTVLSRAFKYLQERAGRIEDAAAGSDFLERNLWNRRLVEAARRYKLL